MLTQKGEEFGELRKASGTEPSDSGLEPGRCDGGVTGSVCYQPHGLCERVLQGTSWEGKTSITLATHWTDRIISMLENRETDIGITPRVFYSKAVEAVPIFREPLFLLSSKSVSDYPEVVQAQQLKRSNEIYFDWGTGFVEWHEKR
mgnify:CR=1 FL=1